MCEECNSVFLNQDTLAVHILAEHMPKGTYLSAGKFVMCPIYYTLSRELIWCVLDTRSFIYKGHEGHLLKEP